MNPITQRDRQMDYYEPYDKSLQIAKRAYAGHMDMHHFSELTDRDVERLRKYLRAWQKLLN